MLPTLAEPLPVTVIGDMLGVPRSDWHPAPAIVPPTW